MLLKGRHYRDALTLARVRLAPGDPLVAEILGQWAERSALGGNIVQSAKCAVSLGKGNPLEAVKFLQRRSNDFEFNLVSLELLLESDSRGMPIFDQVLSSVLKPAVGLGRWRQVYEGCAGRDSPVANQILAFAIFHQVNLFPFRDGPGMIFFRNCAKSFRREIVRFIPTPIFQPFSLNSRHFTT